MGNRWHFGNLQINLYFHSICTIFVDLNNLYDGKPMKHFILVVFIALTSVFASAQTVENATLKVHFTFETAGSAVGSYTGTLHSGAQFTTVAGLPVLALGANNGYFDMGASVGNVIATLNDFTISTNIYIPSSTALGANGNFIYTFANSTNIINDRNGCISFNGKSASSQCNSLQIIARIFAL